MKLFLPTLGTRIVLSKPWAFKLKDERGNEKWWTAVHGQPPQRTPYFYGYDQTTGKYMTSPTQTPVCNRSAEHPAPPQATVLPKGATLLVEQVYIRKGLREYDSLTFRIAKGDPTGVPSGKFSVPLSQVNGKLEGVADLPTKYPKGKFTLSISKGQEYQYCRCHKYPCVCTKTSPDYIRENLLWQSEGEGSRNGGIIAVVEHYRNTAGKDEISHERYYRYRRDGHYAKSFDNIEALLELAKEKGLTDAHIQAFIDRYDAKKDEWEKQKADAI